MTGELLDQVAWGCAISLVVLVLSQLLVVLIFVRALGRDQVKLLEDEHCPPATVILCLRGSDPFLPRCIEQVLRQDYPHYELLILVDHRDDPAWQVAAEVIERLHAKNVRMIPLESPLSTCSLKCSSLAQAFSLRDAKTEFIAQLDADTIPHLTWLRELATKLSEPGIGAATGNRWYMPPQADAGSMVRYLWNSAAVPQMYLYQIAWGGTLAIKVDAVLKSNLVHCWQHAFAEDTMTASQLKKGGYRVGFVPSLMMVNRETCDISGFFNWVQRQLLLARLYHPRFDMVAAHGIFTAFVPLATLVLGCVCLVVEKWWPASLLLGSVVFYQVALLPMLALLEWSVRTVVAHRREPTHWTTTSTILRLFPMLMLTQVIYTSALFSVFMLRKVDWRGVRYWIKGPWDIRLEAYVPYKQVLEQKQLVPGEHARSL